MRSSKSSIERAGAYLNCDTAQTVCGDQKTFEGLRGAGADRGADDNGFIANGDVQRPRSVPEMPLRIPPALGPCFTVWRGHHHGEAAAVRLKGPSHANEEAVCKNQPAGIKAALGPLL